LHSCRCTSMAIRGTATMTAQSNDQHNGEEETTAAACGTATASRREHCDSKQQAARSAR
jgi:hypothetical protein